MKESKLGANTSLSPGYRGKSVNKLNDVNEEIYIKSQPTYAGSPNQSSGSLNNPLGYSM